VLVLLLLVLVGRAIWNRSFAVREVDYVWHTHVSEDGGFSVEMPGASPQVKRSSGGLTTEQVVLADRTIIDISYGSRMDREVQAELDRHVRAYEATPGRKFLTSKRLTDDGLPGHAVISEGRAGGHTLVVYFHIYVTDRRFYYVRWAHLKAHDADPEFRQYIDRFLTSFKSIDPAQEVGSRREYSETGSNTQPLAKPKSDRENYREENRRKEAYMYIVAMEKNRQELVDRLSDAERQGVAFYVEIAREALQKHDETADERLERLTGMPKEEQIAVKREGDSKGWLAPR